MARSLIRTFPAQGLAPAPGSIDLVYFQSAFTASTDTAKDCTSWAVTMLMGANPLGGAQTSYANKLGFSLNGLEPRRLCLEQATWRVKLDGLLASFPSCRTSLILRLPRAEPGIREFVQHVLRMVGEARELDWTVAIAVAEEPSEWGSLAGLHGFIKSSTASLLSDSAAAMALMTTFMSPTLLTLSDELEVLAAVGDAGAPSTVAIPSWNYERRELAFDSERDRINVSKATTLSLSPLWADGSWSDSHELMRQLIPHLADGATAIYNTSTEHFVPSVASARICPVAVLCRGAAMA